MTLRVLLVDDDLRLRELLERFLEPHDVHLEHLPEGSRAAATVSDGGFDAVLLDVMMPGMGGLEVLRKIRERSSIPVLMLTAKGDEADRVVGLELGADDYIPTPFSPRELLARLRAVLRRTRPSLQDERLSGGGVVVDVSGRRATRDGDVIELTALELDILIALMRRAGRVVPRSAIL